MGIQGLLSLAHRNRSDFCDCGAHRGPQKSLVLFETLHCDLRVRWKVASDLRFRAAIAEPKTARFCRISGDLAPSTRKTLAIAIVRFWCAKIISQRWIPKPQFWYPPLRFGSQLWIPKPLFFLVFWAYIAAKVFYGACHQIRSQRSVNPAVICTSQKSA